MSTGNVLITDAKLQATLRAAGWRVTRPRLALCRLLFAQAPRHVTAKHLYAEARAAGLALSPATVQRTLRSLEHLGLIRKLGVGGAEHLFDTDPSEHHHIVLEQDGSLIDVRHGTGIADLPSLPRGARIKGVDVIIRLERDARK